GAITAGKIRVENETVISNLYEPWLGAFPVAVGVFTLVLCAYLAAVYLTAENADDEDLARDFRFRAIVTSVAVALLAVLVASVSNEAPHFRAALLGSWWSVPLQVATALAAAAALLALWTRRFELARVFAIVQVALIVFGWGLAQRPYLIAPDVEIHEAAAPPSTLRLVAGALTLGSLVLFPSLAGMFRVFKLPGKGS